MEDLPSRCASLPLPTVEITQTTCTLKATATSQGFCLSNLGQLQLRRLLTLLIVLRCPMSSAALPEDQGWRNKECSDGPPPHCRTSPVQDESPYRHFFVLKHGWTKGGARQCVYEHVPGKGSLGPPYCPRCLRDPALQDTTWFWERLMCRYILAI